MERCPAPLVIADPRVIVVVGPVTRADVRREIRSDDRARRNPNRSVVRVFHPRAVGIERRAEIGERARIRIRIFRIVCANRERSLIALRAANTFIRCSTGLTGRVSARVRFVCCLLCLRRVHRGAGRDAHGLLITRADRSRCRVTNIHVLVRRRSTTREQRRRSEHERKRCDERNLRF